MVGGACVGEWIGEGGGGKVGVLVIIAVGVCVTVESGVPVVSVTLADVGYVIQTIQSAIRIVGIAEYATVIGDEPLSHSRRAR